MNIANTGLSVPEFLAQLREQGVLASSFGNTYVRFVTHNDVTTSDIQDTLMKISQTVSAVSR